MERKKNYYFEYTLKGQGGGLETSWHLFHQPILHVVTHFVLLVAPPPPPPPPPPSPPLPPIPTEPCELSFMLSKEAVKPTYCSLILATRSS